MEVGDEGDVDRGVGGVEGGGEHGREGGQQGVGQGKFEHLEGDKEVDEEEEDHDGVPGPGVEGEKGTNQTEGDCSERGVEKEERGGSEVRRCHVVLLWSLRRKKKHFFARAFFFGSFIGGRVVFLITWQRKWHSRADFETTREEKMQETITMESEE